MHSSDNPQATHSWGKTILNSVILWLVAFILYLIPGFVVAFSMAFRLGPGNKDTAQVGKLIGQAVGDMYSSTLYIHLAYVAVLVVFIFWRARVISRRVSSKRHVHGALVASVPLVFTALPFLLTAHVVFGVIAVVAFLASGLAGGHGKASPVVARSSPVSRAPVP